MIDFDLNEEHEALVRTVREFARARELEVDRRPPAPLLMGRHLLEMGLSPSPRFREILDAVYEMQLDGRVRNVEEAREAGRILAAEGGGEVS